MQHRKIMKGCNDRFKITMNHRSSSRQCQRTPGTNQIWKLGKHMNFFSASKAYEQGEFLIYLVVTNWGRELWSVV